LLSYWKCIANCHIQCLRHHRMAHRPELVHHEGNRHKMGINSVADALGGAQVRGSAQRVRRGPTEATNSDILTDTAKGILASSSAPSIAKTDRKPAFFLLSGMSLDSTVESGKSRRALTRTRFLL